ncbi:uncharacterized protein LOC116803854 [Drosophila mojavensis]|uniref:uncharacterized protein LOC116803854 n=1 Tax=Drosophila mojavensis TaxID=7230 RepID=UPI0013EEC5DB|nr:uncharacterized protein LOC116803854 [Drosophila mojavensis]
MVKTLPTVKMKAACLTICLLAAVLTAEVHGAIYSGHFKSDAHPGKCVIDDKTILDEGQKINRNCVNIECFSGGDATFASCGAKGIPDNCKLGAKKYPDAEYPKCCIDVIHCPDGDREF